MSLMLRPVPLSHELVDGHEALGRCRMLQVETVSDVVLCRGGGQEPERPHQFQAVPHRLSRETPK